MFDRNTGLISAFFYGVFQPWWTWKTLSFNGEMMMNLPIIWAWAIAFRRSSSRLRPELFAAGVLLAAAAYIVDLCSEPGALYPLRDFPILAKLLAERYQPVARTAEGAIYHRNDYRALAHHGPKSNR